MAAQIIWVAVTDRRWHWRRVCDMMVKESMQDRDSTIKKRRKGGSSNTSTTSAKVPEGDVYKVCEI